MLDRLLQLCRFGAFAVLLGVLPASAQTGNPTHDALAARPQAEQRAEFLGLVRGNGQACADIIAIFFAGFDGQRTAYWDGRCRDGTLYRAGLGAGRWAAPGLLTCGALAPPPAGGPCFQPVQAAPPSIPQASAVAEQRCRASCEQQPAALASACTTRCIRGGGVELGTPVAAQLPANSRFGVVFHTDLPFGAYGFANGMTDRLEVNLRAARACQQMAGRIPCRFVAELVNACGALAQAYSRHPNAIAVTSDPGTVIVNRIETGTGTTQETAEAAALGRCRAAATPGSGIACRIVAAGC